MADNISVTAVLTFCALIVSALVGLLGLRIARGTGTTAELQTVYQVRMDTLTEALAEAKADIRRHQQHVDELMEALEDARAEIRRLEAQR